MLHTSTRRLGAAVAATALSAGALVAVSAPAAQAATVATTFTCTFPSLGAKDIPVGITATLPSAANAGLDAPAIPVLLSVTLPADVVAAAKGLFRATTIGGFSNDMVATLDDLSSSDAADLALQDVRFPQTAVPATAEPAADPQHAQPAGHARRRPGHDRAGQPAGQGHLRHRGAVGVQVHRHQAG